MLPHSLFRALASLLALSVFITGSVHAAVYDYAMGDAGNRTVRLNVPEGLSVVRGILIWGNGGNSDLRGMATDPEVVALAESMGFAVLATSMWTNFLPGYTPSEISGFELALERLAALSNRPELVRAPWLPVGHSNGGNISFGLNTLRPDKVIAVAVNKSEKVNDLRPATTALRTPTLMVAGDADTEARRVGIRDLFFGNRPRGLLGAWVEEEGSNHTYGDAFELILPFAEEIYRLRYPAEVSPAVAPVTLLGSAIVADVAATTAKLAATVGAPLLLPSRMTGYDASWDSAMVVTLPPGVYTAHVSGVEGATGIGMIEIYEVK